MDLLTTVIVVLIVLWAVGLVAIPATGNLIHVLLVLVLILIVIRLLQGRKVLP